VRSDGASAYRPHEWLRSAGCAEALVYVLDDNARGRRFYERAGFAAEATGLPLDTFAFDLTQARYRRAL
jgi:hypothetical protein